MPAAPATRSGTTATALSWEVLRELASFRARTGCAISIYLDLDPRVSPTAAAVQTKTRALLDEARKRTEAARSRRTHEQHASVREGLERIERYFDEEFSREGVHGLAVFTATHDDLWRAFPLPSSVADTVKVNAELYLTPLVPLIGDGVATLVAYIGRERGDLYALLDGRLEPIVSQFEEQPGRHDQGGWSQANYRRHIENLVDRHFRGMAERLERERRRRRAEVVIACSEETRAELTPLLSAETRSAVVGWTQAEAHARAPELLAVVEPLLGQRRAYREAEAVGRWHDEIGRSGRACAGWAATVDAASDGRVDVLLYAPGTDQDVWRCPNCERLQLDGGACRFDGGELERRDDGLDLVLHRTLGRGGTALLVRERRDLDPVGGIGALLRF